MDPLMDFMFVFLVFAERKNGNYIVNNLIIKKNFSRESIK